VCETGSQCCALWHHFRHTAVLASRSVSASSPIAQRTHNRAQVRPRLRGRLSRHEAENNVIGLTFEPHRHHGCCAKRDRLTHSIRKCVSDQRFADGGPWIRTSRHRQCLCVSTSTVNGPPRLRVRLTTSYLGDTWSDCSGHEPACVVCCAWSCSLFVPGAAPCISMAIHDSGSHAHDRRIAVTCVFFTPIVLRDPGWRIAINSRKFREFIVP